MIVTKSQSARAGFCIVYTLFFMISHRKKMVMIALVIVLNTLLSVAMTSAFYIWSSLSLKACF